MLIQFPEDVLKYNILSLPGAEILGNKNLKIGGEKRDKKRQNRELNREIKLVNNGYIL